MFPKILGTWDMRYMKKLWILLLSGSIFVSVLSSGCLDNNGDKNDENKTMTFGELMMDYEKVVDNTSSTVTENFLSLAEGDTVVIQDIIQSLIYVPIAGYTNLFFKSVPETPLHIQGDITMAFDDRDKVELEMHIITVAFTEENSSTGETWTYDVETFMEQWDPDNKMFRPIHQRHIHLIKKAGTVILMTYDEFLNDFTRNFDNETKTGISEFQSLDDGDTVIIQDTIENITYWGQWDYTSLHFASSSGNPFHIHGDITADFRRGDHIEIELSIKNYVFTEEDPDTKEVWTFEYETFREGWNEETEKHIPVPPEYIRHA